MNDRPRQAVILAGGRGTRLAPITNKIPKPMINFHGKPFLEYLVELIRDQEFDNILLLLGYLPEVIIDYFGDGSKWGVKIDYVISDVDDETGRRLKLAQPKIDPTFFLMYCDNYLPFNFGKMWNMYCKESVDALITVYENRDNYTKSNLIIDDSGRLLLYDKNRASEGLQGVDIGFMILKRSVLDMLPDENISFEKYIYPKLIDKRQLHAYVTKHRYYSVGNFKRLPITEKFLARQPAVLIDRDGVLNKKMPRAQYVCSWEDWRWLDGAKSAIQMFKEAGYKIIIISNQAGIARGAMTGEDLENIHKRMIAEVEDAGGCINAIYYCPHDWDEGCECRKPKPEMLFQAQRDFHLDLGRTTFIGDDKRDGMTAEAAGSIWEEVNEIKSLYDVAIKMLNLDDRKR